MTWQDIGEQGARKYLSEEWVIYRSKDGETYQAADQAGWLPGIYASEDAARRALELAQGQIPPRALADAVHWSARGQGDDYRPMTLAEVEALGESTRTMESDDEDKDGACDCPQAVPTRKMTDHDEAVRIVARETSIAMATSDTPYEDVVAALARAGLLARPGERNAEIAAWLRRQRVQWPAQSPQWHFIGELLAALDATPAPETASGAPPECAVCSRPLRWVDDQWICMSCGAEWADETVRTQPAAETTSGEA